MNMNRHGGDADQFDVLSQKPNRNNFLMLGTQYPANFSSYIEFCRAMADNEEAKEYVLPNFDEIEPDLKDTLINVLSKSVPSVLDPVVPKVCSSDGKETGCFNSNSYFYPNTRIGMGEKRNIPFNQISVNFHEEKPSESYAFLIYKALDSSATGKLTLSEIYTWIEKNYIYYKTADPVWKNSIRHNLSLNQTFVKIPRPLNSKGKGGYWAIDMSQRHTIIGKSKRQEHKNSISNEMVSFKPNMIY